MSCKNCNNYNAFCKGGVCDRHNINVSPNDTCAEDMSKKCNFSSLDYYKLIFQKDVSLYNQKSAEHIL